LDAAIGDYGKAIALNSQDALAYTNRGAAKLSKGDLDGALADEDRAIQLSPGEVLAYMNRSAVRKKLGDASGSSRDFAKALQLNPQAEKLAEESSKDLAESGKP
jgi:tetratricopeptide (TPR) repeat protein